MQALRYWHRWVTLIIAVFVLYLGVTGTIIQLVDLRSILTGAPARDANMIALRESFDGPEDFLVRRVADYEAPALPADFDYAGALPRLLSGARATADAAPLRYLEFRVEDGRPVGQAGIGPGFARFDAATGKLLARFDREPHDDQQPVSIRNTFKHLHRMTTFGNWALTINLVVSAGLIVMIVTGVLIYWKLYKGRRRIRRAALFWKGGGTWRMLHRWTSILAMLFLLVVSLSGAWLAVESAGLAIYFARHMPSGGARPAGPPPVPPGMTMASAIDPMLPAMLATTLRAVHADAPATPINVVRLRVYANYPQGVVVTGGADMRQRVYNARSGAAMSETEPGYPPSAFPFGWQAHQIAKSVHRGDYFGLTGRWIDLLSGLALTYLSLSGIVLYWQMWRKRRATGRRAVVWN